MRVVAGAQASRYDPWADLASRAGLTCVVTRLPLGDAWYLPDVPGIALDDRLGRTERRCVLAHELAHIDLGHRQLAGSGPGTGRLARRNEVAADLLAATRLVALDDLLAWVPFAAAGSELAELLDVTVHLLTVRLEHLTAPERRRIAAAVAARAEVA